MHYDLPANTLQAVLLSSCLWDIRNFKKKTMSAFTSLINGSVLGELTETKGLNEE